MGEVISKVLKLIIVFYELGKKYTRDMIAGGGSQFVYTDDGDGNITISIEED
ncbi:MAG: hypothetical protein IJI27_08070 [Oscillospiraceae bacterium]|nr:hypothetical protein [Oscillospiraceae bacterium]